MEKAQTGVVHNNSESNSIISCIDNDIDLSKEITIDTDDNELSKEREEELLFGAEGDDEDVLSDDSLRLRLSDDEDLEQEGKATNISNVTDLKLQNKKVEYVNDVITEKKTCSDIQQIVEEVDKPNDEKSEEEHNSAIETSKNSTLSSDNASKNKDNHKPENNLKNINMTISVSNEECTSKSNKDVKITAVSTECSNAESEQHVTLENDNLSTKNHIQISNIQNTEQITHSNLEDTVTDNLKETISDHKEMNTTNSCELNKVDNLDSNSSINTTKVQISDSEKLSMLNSNNDDNLNIKEQDNVLNNDSHSVKSSFVEINNSQDSTDSIKSSNFNDLPFPKDYVEHNSKNSNTENENITQSKNAIKEESLEKETSSLLTHNQNNSLGVKDSKELINEDHDNSKSVTQTTNSSTPTLQKILLEYNNVKNSNNENINTGKRKRSKTTIDIIEDCNEDNQEKKKPRKKRKS